MQVQLRVLLKVNMQTNPKHEVIAWSKTGKRSQQMVNWMN